MIAILCTVTGYKLLLLKQTLICRSMRRTHMYLSVTAPTSVLDMTHSLPMMEQKTDTPAKLIHIPCSAINVHKLENLFVMLGENEIAAVDEVFTRIPNPWRTTVSDYEVVPESYSQAVLDPERRKSMMSEIKALRNIGCWRV